MTTLTGVRRLVRLALRRDRIVLPIWILGLAALIVAIVSSVLALYTSEAERIEAAAFSAGNRIARVFDGPAAGPEPGSLGLVEAYAFMAILIGLFSAQTIVRHTRQDEETGRAELMGAGVIGRHARLTAALLITIGANLVLGGLVTVALIVANDLPVGGSVMAGASFAGVGMVFAGVAAITAQIAEQARPANALAGAAIGVAFVVRAIGDAGGRVADSGVEVVSAWPSWLSPIGWGQQLRPYGDARPWLLALFVVTTLVLAAVAFTLTNHRDVGSGMREVPRGPARAPRGLLSPLGLAWRQQRGVLVGWSVAMLTFGVAFGIVGEGADEVVATSEQFAEMLEEFGGGAALIDGFFAFLMRLMGIVAAGYTVQALLRLRAEEAAGRVEPILATAVSRSRWLLSHTIIAFLGTVLVIALAGVGAGLAFGIATGDVAGGIAGPVSAALVQIPAALTLGAVVVLVFGLVPRWAPAIAWAALAASFVVGQFGELLELPQAVINVVPFSHAPLLPAADLTATPILVLLALATVVTAAAFVVFRRRDLVTVT